jgi:hypothetical protein
LIGYLVERKHCFLETTEWKTVPWEEVGLGAKLPIDKLHDILCDIPGYLEDIDLLGKWTRDSSDKENFLTKLRERLLASLNALYSWRWEWEKDFPASTYSVSPNGLDPETSLPLPPSPFESVLWFVNPYRANELMTYNSIRVILTRSLQLIGINTDNPSSAYVSDPLLPMQGTRHDVAVETCRMVDYHLHCFRRSSGAFLIIFPINIAYLHLDGNRDGRAKSWLEIVMAFVADIHGFEIGRRENMPRKLDKVLNDSRTKEYQSRTLSIAEHVLIIKLSNTVRFYISSYISRFMILFHRLIRIPVIIVTRRTL